jgi:hypothetical protein
LLYGPEQVNEHFDCGMASFLTGIISGDRACDLLPKGFPGVLVKRNVAGHLLFTSQFSASSAIAAVHSADYSKSPLVER